MYSNNNQISNFLKRVHVNSHVRSRGPEVKNQKEDYSCYKRGLPESSPMFFDFSVVRRLASHNRASRY